MKNNEILDAISEAIDQTINHFIDKDIYYYIAPYLSEKEIGFNCPFFRDNRISVNRHHSLNNELSPPYTTSESLYPGEDEYPQISLEPTFELYDKSIIDETLRTISYLAPFQRNRVAYNPKFIDYYLQTLLHISYAESAINILCFEDGKCGEDNSYITYNEWLSFT